MAKEAYLACILLLCVMLYALTIGWISENIVINIGGGYGAPGDPLWNKETNTKCVPYAPRYTPYEKPACNADAGNRGKRFNREDQFPDTFIIYERNGRHGTSRWEVCARRVDSGPGWAMGLQISCRVLGGPISFLSWQTDGVDPFHVERKLIDAQKNAAVLTFVRVVSIIAVAYLVSLTGVLTWMCESDVIRFLFMNLPLFLLMLLTNIWTRSSKDLPYACSLYKDYARAWRAVYTICVGAIFIVRCYAMAHTPEELACGLLRRDCCKYLLAFVQILLLACQFALLGENDMAQDFGGGDGNIHHNLAVVVFVLASLDWVFELLRLSSVWDADDAVHGRLYKYRTVIFSVMGLCCFVGLVALNLYFAQRLFGCGDNWHQAWQRHFLWASLTSKFAFPQRMHNKFCIRCACLIASFILWGFFIVRQVTSGCPIPPASHAAFDGTAIYV